MPTIPSPATAPAPHAQPPVPFEVMQDLNDEFALAREEDRTYIPGAETQSHITDLAGRIAMTQEGAVGYTLDGLKIDSTLARTFLDNKIRTDDMIHDPTLTEVPRGIIIDDVQESALDNFIAYTEKQNASLPIPEGFRLGAKGAKKLGKLAMRGAQVTSDIAVSAAYGAVSVAGTVANKASETAKAAGRAAKHAAINEANIALDITDAVLHEAGESSKAASQLSKIAMNRARQASTRAAIAARDKSFEVGRKPKQWATKKYVEMGAFATALRADMPEVLKDLDDKKELDKVFYNFANYDSDNAREVTRRTLRRATVNIAAARDTKDAAKQAWKNRKT